MKGPLYISDDEKKQGTQAEVEAYEKALNPLAKFQFPWRDSMRGIINSSNGSIRPIGDDTCALLNLMPLVEELRREWNTDAPYWRKSTWTTRSGSITANLLLAYEKALGIEQPS